MKNIEEIFENHWKYYANLGIETYKQQSGQIKQVSEEYAGRVLYELLQNAFDKAESKVLVKYDNEYLYVANNGKPFSIYEYDYIGEKENTKRSDFHSLCSISTSTKDANENIGNKGVGFKSVFSLNEYADIFTKINNEWINFKIYGEIKNINDDFKDLNEKFKLKEKISSIKNEYEDRGIPGFYFPILLDEKIKDFEDYVTIIRIKANKDKIKNLFEELKKIHFYFIKEKIKEDIEVIFETPFDVENKKVTNNKSIYTFKLSNELKDFNIKKPIISIYYKINNNYNDLFYNFMPTKVKSPFCMVDFNADFHTSINRENIKFQGDNAFLLKALMELHLIIIAKKFDVDLKLLNLSILKNEVDKIDITNLKFDKKYVWKYLNIKKEFFEYLKEILNEENYIEFITQIARQYFEKNNLEKEDYDDFWNIIFHLFDLYDRKNVGSYIFAIDWIRRRFNDKILFKLQNISCIPIIENNIIKSETLQKKIFYKDKNENLNLQILEIPVTNYDFVGQINVFLEKNEFTNIHISKLTDYDEILKYFRQCDINGNYEKIFISENEQKEILKSVYEIFKRKKENDYFSYRFNILFKELQKDAKKRQYSKLNAIFSISTLFLRTKSNKFKPAQYCHKDEIDESFLNFVDKVELNQFLNFLGVSIYNDILCVDFEKKEFLEGIDKPPALLDANNNEDKIIWEDLVKNVRIYKNNVFKHPVEFTTNTLYENILEKIDLYNKYPTLKYLIKPIKDFNKIYIELMIDLLEKNRDKQEVVIKIYKEMYRRKKDWIKKFLYFTTSNTLEFSSNKNEIYATNDKAFFNLAKGKVNLFSVLIKDKDEEFKTLEIEIMKSNNKSNIKQKLELYLPYILLEISLSEKSERDFREEDLKELKNKWLQIEFYESDEVRFKINDKEFSEEKFEVIYNKNSNFVLHQKNIELYKFSNFLAKFLYISELKTNIENVLLKDISILQKEMGDEIESIEWNLINEEKQKEYFEQLKKTGYKGKFKYIYECEDFPNKKISEIKKIFSQMPEIYFKCEKNSYIEKFKTKYNLIVEECEKINDILKEYEDKTTLNIEEVKKKIKEECGIDDIDKQQEELLSEYLPNLEEETRNINPIKIEKNKSKQNKETSAKELEESKKQIDIAKNKRGINAERIFAKTKFANIDKELIKKCIDKFIPESWKKTKEKLKNIKTFEDLRISRVSVAAGFDVVVTENNEIWLCEIKSVDLNNIYFYLSENEITTMKRYKCKKHNEQCNIQWKLILVDEKQHKYKDVTNEVFNLLYEKNCEEKDYLKSLKQKGITFDSLIFHFK